MQAYETAERKDDATLTSQPDSDPAPEPDLDAPVFGVDRDGSLHRFDDGDVVVTRDGDLERVETDVGRDSVDAWISYVGGERGWIDVWWNAEGADTVARLSNALGVVDDQEAE